MKCSVCKGAGKQTITARTLVKGGSWKKEPPVTIPCLGCKGTGEMTQEQADALRTYEEMWCRCGNPSGESSFYDDGEHPGLAKHHYRCVDCGRVTQIG